MRIAIFKFVQILVCTAFFEPQEKKEQQQKKKPGKNTIVFIDKELEEKSSVHWSGNNPNGINHDIKTEESTYLPSTQRTRWPLGIRA